MHHSLFLFCSLFIFSKLVFADVYVASQAADTIEISSNPIEDTAYFRIEEPIEATPRAAVTSPTQNSLPYHQEVVEAANETALDPALIHAVIAVESKHNPQAVSRKGAHGLMQLMPTTAKRFNADNPANPKQNIMAGARYLKELKELYHGDLNLTLAAYNAGPAAVDRYHGQIPPFMETQLYVPKVLKLYQQYSGKKS